jgi:hypothetical protein
MAMWDFLTGIYRLIDQMCPLLGGLIAFLVYAIGYAFRKEYKQLNHK